MTVLSYRGYHEANISSKSTLRALKQCVELFIIIKMRTIDPHSHSSSLTIANQVQMPDIVLLS